METTKYKLSDHQFLATPNMEAMYVIHLGETGLPQIVAAVTIPQSGDPLLSGLSIRLLSDDVLGEVIEFQDGFTFDATAQTVNAGKVLIQKGNSQEGNTFVRLAAYFNGAVIDTGNRTLTAAGIGITDILSADPLEVGLVSAPLTFVKDYDGSIRNVEGLYVRYVALGGAPFNSTTTRGLWEVTIVLKPAA